MESQNSQNQSTTGNNTLMAAISYLGPLVIVAYLIGKDNQFVKFHVKQGLVVFGIEVLVWIITSTMMFYSFWMFINIINLATLILSVIGIINAVSGKQKELPLVGGLAKNFTF